MQANFAAYLQALIAENTSRAGQQPPLPALNVADVDIAGGGDGHTFVVRILLTTNASAGGSDGWAANDLADVMVNFWMGASAEALADYQEGALAALTAGTQDVQQIAVGCAGSAKGTRFMAFIGGVRQSPSA